MEPVAQQRIPQAPMYVYPNMHHPNSTANLTSLSMAGTLPVRSRMGEISVPVSRYFEIQHNYAIIHCV